MFGTLLNKIETVLATITTIQEIWKYEVEEFSGDPVVVVVPSNNESEYNTTQENVRVYAFSLRIYVNRTKRTNAKQEADRILRGLVDSVIDKFDKYYTFGPTSPGGSIVCPTGYTFINVFAMPSAWGYAGREDEYRVAEVNLKCRVSVSLNQIS